MLTGVDEGSRQPQSGHSSSLALPKDSDRGALPDGLASPSGAASPPPRADAHLADPEAQDSHCSSNSPRETSSGSGVAASAAALSGGSAAISEHHANGLVDQTSYMPGKQVIVVFLSLQLAVLISFLEQTIVSTALPNISAVFNAGRSSSFVAAAYLLMQCAMQPVWGRLSDIFGRKYTLITCLVIFTIASLACALAQSMLQLIVFRGAQGFGGGRLMNLVMIIISDIVSLKERGKYQAITEVTIIVGNGVGPVIGGVMAERLSWRWCFWINLPIAGVSIAIIAVFLPLKKVRGSMLEKLKQIDYGGALLTIAATVLLILPLNWGGTSFPWVSGPVIGGLVGGFVGFAVFFLWEWKIARIPVVPPSIFTFRTVSTVAVATFLSGATVLVQLFYLPQLFQVVRGDSAIRSGILIIPQLVTSTLFVGISGLIVSRTGEYKPSICLGYAMWAIGLALISTLDDKSSTARIVGYQLFSGAGQGQTLQTSMVAVQAAVPRSEMSVVTSTRLFLRAMGGTIFTVVAATIINTILRSRLDARGFAESTISTIIDDPTSIWASASVTGTASLDGLDTARKEQIISAYVAGFQTLFRVLVALIGFDFVITLLLVERHSLQKDDEAALKERGKAWAERRKAKRRGRRAHKVDAQAAPGDSAEEEDKGDKQEQHGHDEVRGQQAV